MKKTIPHILAFRDYRNLTFRYINFKQSKLMHKFRLSSVPWFQIGFLN